MTRADHFAEHGIAIVEYALEPDDLVRMAAAFENTNASAGARQSLFPPGLIDWLDRHLVLSRLARELSDHARPKLVRVIAFDKTPEANWFVPWHQDRSIAVAARAEVAGFERWTVKDGVPHVEPPEAILQGMLTLRIHLDDCGEDNGPLECIGGSHRHGRLDKAAINRIVAEGDAKLCLCAAGDILAIRPLTVHRSQRARIPARRRVLHLEYATAELPPPLSFDLAATPTEHLH